MTYSQALPTKEAVARAVVLALRARDVRRLEGLSVTEGEFRTLVWPRLPAASPGAGVPVDYAWADTSSKSRGYLANVLAEFGGRTLDVEAIRFLGATRDYGTFRIHGKASVRVRDEAGRREVRLFGSLLESDDGWKVFSYVID
jgi:hypothetical protein